jgi:hypothetical protein
MSITRRLLFYLALTAAAVPGCGSEDPTRFGRPPVVDSYAPAERHLSAFVGDTLQFSVHAVDPDRDAVKTSFTVDGGVGGNGVPWFYPVADTGDVTVRGSVSDGEFVSYIEWTVERHQPINYPPAIGAFQPIEPNPTLIIGNSMSFAIVASDPDDDQLLYTFIVNDSLVSESRQFSYLASSVGPKRVRATVTDGELFDIQEWNLRVTTEPDTIAPARVEITGSGTGIEPGEVYLEWIAVGRDGMLGRPSEYRVRTAPNPILSEDDWNRGSQRPGVPVPAPPGSPMSMMVGGLLPARTTYLAVRAIDDFGNISPLSDSPSAVTRGMSVSGTVINTESGLPVEGAEVRIGLFTADTATDGSWTLTELPPIDDMINAGDVAPTGAGEYFDLSMPYVVRHLAVTPLYVIPNRALGTANYMDFLQFFRSMTDVSGNPYGTQERRWRLPIDLYVRAYEKEGLDYQATIVRVAAEFDAILGTQVFNVSTNRSGTGVETTYLDGLYQDNYAVKEWTSDWYPNLALIEFRTVYTPASAAILERTVRHELGHALGLNHSSDRSHLMVGGVAPQVNQFSADEIAVIRCLYNIPRGFDNRRFLHR